MPKLQTGRVYRTRDFARYDSNPTRLVAKLVEQGKLKRLRHGLYHAPAQGAFGEVPPAEEALLRAYFGGNPFLRTGPSVWNGLGLGSTAVEAVPLVYNTTLTGKVELGGRPFEFRRTRFPRNPSREFFVVDLLQNSGRAGVDRGQVQDLLARAVEQGQFDTQRLRSMAGEFGTREVQARVETALALAPGR
jgi:hypothetical protein